MYKYLRNAIVDAKKQMGSLQTIHGIGSHAMGIITVLQMCALGPLKSIFVKSVKQFRDYLPGMVLLLYPRIPHKEWCCFSFHAEDAEVMSMPDRYSKRLIFELDNGDIVQGLLLVKTSEDEQDVQNTSALLKTGVFTDVPVDTPVSVSRKASFDARRALQEGYSWNAPASTRDMRHRKTQLGERFHQVWLKDLVEHARKKHFMIFDPWSGAGDLGLSVLNLMHSQETHQSGTRLYYMGREYRRYMYEVTNARLRSLVAELYLEKKYKVGDREPTPNPGEEPLRSKALVQSMLPAPLKILQLSPVGSL